MTTTQKWQQTCPLCGQDNRCAMAAGREVSSCWCYEVKVSAEALAAVPTESVGSRCLCPSCATKQGESEIAG